MVWEAKVWAEVIVLIVNVWCGLVFDDCVRRVTLGNMLGFFVLKFGEGHEISILTRRVKSWGSFGVFSLAEEFVLERHFQIV